MPVHATITTQTSDSPDQPQSIVSEEVLTKTLLEGLVGLTKRLTRLELKLDFQKPEQPYEDAT